jgi:hypothetical protein
VPDDELETLWLLCSNACWPVEPHFDYPWLDIPCEDLGATTECRLGTGTGRFEFEVPPLHAGSLSTSLVTIRPQLSLHGMVAWAGQDVEACWAARRAGNGADRCGYTYHDVGIGPVWWALVYEIAEGIEPPLEDGDLLDLVSLQPANRIPLAPTLTVWVNGELAAVGVPPLSTIPVEPGTELRIELAFDPVSQSLQRMFVPLDPPRWNAWTLVNERLYSQTATSGAIRWFGSPDPIVDDGSFVYRVVPDAAPGISRVLILYEDTRGAADFVSLEFEVRDAI